MTYDKARHALNELCELASRHGSASYVTQLKFDLLHALNNAQAEANQVHTSIIAWVHEDELPSRYPYERLFPYSKVDIVRMFPIFGPTAAPALTEEQIDAAEVIKIMSEGGWELSCPEPWSALTDEANAEMRWRAKRTDAPFCGRDGKRMWTGPTAIKAVTAARAALRSTQGGE